MGIEDRIDVDIFKVVTRAIAESDNLIVMASHLSQLLVGTLGIKGCAIFVFNPESKELESLGSFGLRMGYLAKGPVLSASMVSALVMILSSAYSSAQLSRVRRSSENFGGTVGISPR